MNKTTKNSFVYLMGSIIMGVLGLVSSMLLTRILQPTEYGEYGKLVTFSSAAVTLMSIGFDLAYTRFYYTQKYTQKRYLFMALKYPLVAFAAFSVVLLVPDFFIAKKVLSQSVTLITVILIISDLFAQLIHKFTQITARMEEHAFNYILSNIIARSGFLIILWLIFAIKGNITFNWIVFSFMISANVSVFINLVVMLKTLNKKTGKDEEITVKEMFNYGWPYMINNALILVIPLAEKLVLEEVGGKELLGIFSAASIFQTVVLLLTNTLTNIWNPLVYKHCDDEKTFKPLLHSFGVAMTLVSMLAMAAVILLRRWLVLILGSDYYEIYAIAPSVMFGALYHILTIIYSVGINISKKTYHFIISPILQALISFGLCFLLIPKLGLLGIAISSLASLILSKTYRITVGLYYYGSGKPEWKMIILSVLGVVVSITSMFFTSLTSDVLTFAIIMAITALVIGREFVPLFNLIKGLILPKRKKGAK